MNMIDSRQLAALVQENVIKSVSVQGTAGGFMIQVNGNLIEAKRGHPRVFRKLQTVASYLKSKGIGEFTVNVARWSPDQSSIL
jgi:hypothetical protein